MLVGTFFDILILFFGSGFDQSGLIVDDRAAIASYGGNQEVQTKDDSKGHPGCQVLRVEINSISDLEDGEE